MTVFVLWEDKAKSPIARFGPHVFLVACVASRLGTPDRHKLMRSKVIRGKTCAGNGNLLRELANEPLWDSPMYVVAVLDTDEIHDRLPRVLSRRTVADAGYSSWLDSAINEVRKHAAQAQQARLEICFLDRNMETLLSVVGQGMPQLSQALRKDPLERDKILHKAAADEALIRRACSEMPSWNALVTTVTRLLESNMELIADNFFRNR